MLDDQSTTSFLAYDNNTNANSDIQKESGSYYGFNQNTQSIEFGEAFIEISESNYKKDSKGRMLDAAARTETIGR